MGTTVDTGAGKGLLTDEEFARMLTESSTRKAPVAPEQRRRAEEETITDKSADQAAVRVQHAGAATDEAPENDVKAVIGSEPGDPYAEADAGGSLGAASEDLIELAQASGGAAPVKPPSAQSDDDGEGAGIPLILLGGGAAVGVAALGGGGGGGGSSSSAGGTGGGGSSGGGTGGGSGGGGGGSGGDGAGDGGGGGGTGSGGGGGAGGGGGGAGGGGAGGGDDGGGGGDGGDGDDEDKDEDDDGDGGGGGGGNTGDGDGDGGGGGDGGNGDDEDDEDEDEDDDGDGGGGGGGDDGGDGDGEEDEEEEHGGGGGGDDDGDGDDEEDEEDEEDEHDGDGHHGNGHHGNGGAGGGGNTGGGGNDDGDDDGGDGHDEEDEEDEHHGHAGGGAGGNTGGGGRGDGGADDEEDEHPGDGHHGDKHDGDERKEDKREGKKEDENDGKKGEEHGGHSLVSVNSTEPEASGGSHAKVSLDDLTVQATTLNGDTRPELSIDAHADGEELDASSTALVSIDGNASVKAQGRSGEATVNVTASGEGEVHIAGDLTLGIAASGDGDPARAHASVSADNEGTIMLGGVNLNVQGNSAGELDILAHDDGSSVVVGDIDVAVGEEARTEVDVQFSDSDDKSSKRHEEDLAGDVVIGNVTGNVDGSLEIRVGELAGDGAGRSAAFTGEGNVEMELHDQVFGTIDVSELDGEFYLHMELQDTNPETVPHTTILGYDAATDSVEINGDELSGQNVAVLGLTDDGEIDAFTDDVELFAELEDALHGHDDYAFAVYTGDDITGDGVDEVGLGVLVYDDHGKGITTVLYLPDVDTVQELVGT